MKIFAIGDLHLSFGVPDKGMEFFGPQWQEWTKKLEAHWKDSISKDELVLIPGDISWAMKLEEAEKDFAWIESLPGKKVIIKGNHDYWWGSISKVRAFLPPSITALQNDAIEINGIAICGTRLWDTPEYHFSKWVDYRENPKENTLLGREKDEAATLKIYERELARLKLSLDQMEAGADLRIAMTHYPPIGGDLLESRAASLLESYQVNISVFGHLHQLKKGSKLFGVKNGVDYKLVSCDWLDFQPLRLL
jgi:predicted phosphohydrolase